MYEIYYQVAYLKIYYIAALYSQKRASSVMYQKSPPTPIARAGKRLEYTVSQTRSNWTYISCPQYRVNFQIKTRANA